MTKIRWWLKVRQAKRWAKRQEQELLVQRYNKGKRTKISNG